MNHQRNNGSSSVCGAEGRLVRDRRKVDCPDCLALDVPAMGRPRRADDVGRNRTIRATDDEWARWQREAGDRPVSDWIRETLNRAARERDVL